MRWIKTTKKNALEKQKNMQIRDTANFTLATFQFKTELRPTKKKRVKCLLNLQNEHFTPIWSFSFGEMYFFHILFLFIVVTILAFQKLCVVFVIQNHKIFLYFGYSLTILIASFKPYIWHFSWSTIISTKNILLHYHIEWRKKRKLAKSK